MNGQTREGVKGADPMHERRFWDLMMEAASSGPLAMRAL
jgi:hypothetical protein